MKVKFVGFGGYIEKPCYEDKNGKIYFDENDGRNWLSLYTGAYRDEVGEICGEPCTRVTETVACDDPFIRHAREQDYMLLSRLENDCQYFLGCGNGCERHLYYQEVNAHCAEMEKLYKSFADQDKPEWINLEKIADYRDQMIQKRRNFRCTNPKSKS